MPLRFLLSIFPEWPGIYFMNSTAFSEMPFIILLDASFFEVLPWRMDLAFRAR
jgi:hypothetical protein